MNFKLPRTLTNFNVLVDGHGHAGVATEVTPPKLTVKTEEHRAGGMDAPIQIDMGMEKLECSFTLAEYNPQVLGLFGLTSNSVTQLTLRGVMSGAAGNAAIVIELNGNIKEVDPGTWKAGDKAECKFTVACTYYKLSIGGVEIHEIDLLNMVRKINGEDQLASQRAMLGLQA